MKAKQISVEFSAEAMTKIQSLAEANGTSLTKAVNEIVLRPNDAFQREVRFILEHGEVTASRIVMLERNLATVTDILASMAGSLELIKTKIVMGN